MCNIYIKVEQGVESYSKRNCYACRVQKIEKIREGYDWCYRRKWHTECVRVRERELYRIQQCDERWQRIAGLKTVLSKIR